jgi:hypothetical protein
MFPVRFELNFQIIYYCMNLRLRWIKEEWYCSLWQRVVLTSLLSWRRSRPVQPVPGLNIGRDYRCRDWDFTWVSSVSPEKWRDGTSFSIRPLPSQSLPLHHCYHRPCRLSCWQCSDGISEDILALCLHGQSLIVKVEAACSSGSTRPYGVTPRKTVILKKFGDCSLVT